MNDYETIYNDAFKHDYWEKGGTTHTAAYAGIAAVVAAAKAEALEEAATAPAPNFGDSIKDIIARYGSTN